MKKIIASSLTLGLLSLAYAAAYKIPEQSIKSLALGGAYVAGADEADCAYFNPANMSFLNEKQRFELALTAIYLPKIKYSGKQIVGMSGNTPIYYKDVYGKSADNETKSESFLIPHLHFISKPFGKVRYGLSLTTPAGLSKRWEEQPQTWSAKQFTLRTLEFNPTISYLVNDNFSIGAGVRALFTDGKIKLNPPVNSTTSLDYDMKGDIRTVFGYNLALSYRFDKSFIVSATYRSKIDLKEKGDTTITTYNNGNKVNEVDTTGKVTVPLPATLILATSLDLNEKARFEIVYERTFWSSYKKLKIEFDDAENYNIEKDKDWDDTNTFRVGLTYKNSDKLTTMYGLSYDQTPIPAKTLGYELPDSDALILSLGALYKYKENISLGIAYLYDYKFKREINLSDQNINGIVGEFSKGGAHLLNLSFNYRF
ncbi:OmpP1/FadL family transporter [Nitrosophilus kaiyonis]|uniref:OmpP1/FadL family transporter n=1 Tax=Nitrosophilus kaiyonis TaxID=2930200 RepID=UPI0024920EE5|nr:OmpP1/FadL family transporter [Nitrosophilus kaiyonis]